MIPAVASSLNPLEIRKFQIICLGLEDPPTNLLNLLAILLPDPNYERDRKRIVYDKSQIDYYAGDWTEVAPGHFVLGTKEEIENWKQSRK